MEQLEEQVAYLKAFGQAVRVQLRSYLEALISDVETEWGRADPALLPQDAVRPPAQRSGREPAGATSTTFVGNTAAESPPDDDGRGRQRADHGRGAALLTGPAPPAPGPAGRPRAVRPVVGHGAERIMGSRRSKYSVSSTESFSISSIVARSSSGTSLRSPSRASASEVK